ncbi:unnamed protein product, partial [Owenia fusiformis]
KSKFKMVSKKLEKIYTIWGKIGLFCGLFGVVLTIVAFVSGHWFEAEKDSDSHFKRLGLWEACFDGYHHPANYVGKVHRGCWWILHVEYWYIRSWLLPCKFNYIFK